ncbi:MAG: DNA topoisomerase IV subunit A [Parachlamydiales bacterium]|jgi:topoisomerase-4 subunit A
MEDLKQLMKRHYLKYASYVILERAVPKIEDGLKPVQRRILHALMMMNDGKLHKVANVVGQTMAYHPHGDAPIYEALVNLSNKGYMLDQQGNFGNIYTGDPAAAARYIETRLSQLALHTLFNPDLTATVPSYDGRHQEPVALPAKIPLLLMQGAEGIAVGMSTQILPHNFTELLKAQIDILNNKNVTLVPDFPTGGIMDAGNYNNGKGKVRLRVRLEIKDPKTIVITDICYGTTTESLIRSIDEAAKKGKVKLEAINDYTAEKVEVEIKLPRGHYAEEVLEALYHYTECEVTLHPQMLLIKDNMPCEMDVEEILRYNTEKLEGYLKRELEIERDALIEKIFNRTLEQIFIEERMYKHIEEKTTLESIHEVLRTKLEPFHSQLTRIPEHEDRERLLNIPIRRISRYDSRQNEEDIKSYRKEVSQIEKSLKNVVAFTIHYIEGLIEKYGKLFPRKTEVQALVQIDKRAVETQAVKVYYDAQAGFVGTKVASGHLIECTNFDKLLFIFKDGSYQVMNLPEKNYIHQDGKQPVYVGIADKKTVFNVLYRSTKTRMAFAKRFVVSQYMLDKLYLYLEEDSELLYLGTAPGTVIDVHFVPLVRQKIGMVNFAFDDVLIKGVTAKGIRVANRAVKKIVAPATKEAK